MALRFRLSEFGRVFATRGRGRELREELIGRARASEPTVVDFSDVTNVTYSFADEFAGKLVQDGSMPVELENMTAAVADTVERAVERRAAPPARC